MQDTEKGLSTTDIDLQSFYDASVVCATQVEPYSGASNINILTLMQC